MSYCYFCSPIVDVSRLFAEMVQHGLRCIAFCKSRKLCELVLSYAYVKSISCTCFGNQHGNIQLVFQRVSWDFWKKIGFMSVCSNWLFFIELYKIFGDCKIIIFSCLLMVLSMFQKLPSHAVNIRAIETLRYSVIDQKKNEVLEEIEESKAFFQVVTSCYWYMWKIDFAY